MECFSTVQSPPCISATAEPRARNSSDFRGLPQNLAAAHETNVNFLTVPTVSLLQYDKFWLQGRPETILFICLLNECTEEFQNG